MRYSHSVNWWKTAGILIIAGTIFLASGLLMGARDSSIAWDSRGRLRIYNRNTSFTETASYAEIIAIPTTAPGSARDPDLYAATINSITAFITSADISLIPAAEFRIESNLPEQIVFDWHIQDGELNLSARKDSVFNIFSMDFSSNSYSIHVYYPAEIVFADISITSSSGDISLDAIKTRSMVLVTSSGDITIAAAEIGNMDVVTNSGDIRLVAPGKESDYAYNLVSATGNIQVGTENARYLLHSTDTNPVAKNISVVTRSGDITIVFEE